MSVLSPDELPFGPDITDNQEPITSSATRVKLTEENPFSRIITPPPAEDGSTAPSLPVRMTESRTSFQSVLEGGFADFGIKIKFEDLKNFLDYYNYVKEGRYPRNLTIENEQIIPWIFSNLPLLNPEEGYTFSFGSSKVILSTKNFKGVSNISVFSTLKTDTVERKVISRMNIKYEKNEDILESFVDNIKHLILYLVIKFKYNKKFAFIPQPFFFGKMKFNDKLKFIFIMDQADKEIGQAIVDKLYGQTLTSENIKYVRKLMYSYYYGLYHLNNYLDYFYHGDSHVSNVMVKNDKVVLIDFGHCSFQIEGIRFVGAFERFSGRFFDKVLKYHLPVQDYIKLIVSFGDVFRKSLIFDDFCKIINVKSDLPNSERFIGYAIYPCINFYDSILKMKERTSNKNYQELYKNFYIDIFDTDSNLKNFKRQITPEQMKIDFGLEYEDDDSLFNEYYKKYLKYKNKYLNLKKGIN